MGCSSARPEGAQHSALGRYSRCLRTGTVTTLHDFTGGSEGELPYAAPIQSVKGDFYGTTSGNDSLGTPPFGSVYRITEDGQLHAASRFYRQRWREPSGAAGSRRRLLFLWNHHWRWPVVATAPSSGSAQAVNFQVLVNFDGTNGKLPFSGLIQANDGNFYGVTSHGGSSNKGVLFRMTPDGVLTVLHNFTGGSDGARPMGGLVQASDGNLYGTGKYGGKNGVGVLFRATLAGDVVPLHDFDYDRRRSGSAVAAHQRDRLRNTLEVAWGPGRCRSTVSILACRRS